MVVEIGEAFSKRSKIDPAQLSLGEASVHLRERAEQTSTATSALRLLYPATMSKNFSAPKSVPNPPSVTTKSASLSVTRVARIESFPCAMLAKGPPWTNAG